MKSINPKLLIVTIIGLLASLDAGGYFALYGNSDKHDTPTS